MPEKDPLMKKRKKTSCTTEEDSLVLVPAVPETEAMNQVGAAATETTPEESARENPVLVPETQPNQRTKKLFKAGKKKGTFLSLFLHNWRQKVKVSKKQHQSPSQRSPLLLFWWNLLMRNRRRETRCSKSPWRIQKMAVLRILLMGKRKTIQSHPSETVPEEDTDEEDP